ncbi:hypothetical protein ACFE04_016740 [Oxalis oulophora]
MKGFLERAVTSKYSSKSTADSPNRSPSSVSSETSSEKTNLQNSYLFSGFFASAFSIFGTSSESSCEEKSVHTRENVWTTVKRVVGSNSSMWRLQERVLGPSKTGIASSTSDIWLLGVHYKISQDDSSGDSAVKDGLTGFKEDFSSRILITYRKGFDAIGDSKFTSDVGWGCMLRSSQMLIAQALLFHRLGRSWRKTSNKQLDKEYIEILNLFGDSEASAFSLHNLLRSGKTYGLAAGSWVGPYAMCRSWESLARQNKDDTALDFRSLPIAICVVSGEADGERGGAPVLYIEDVSRKSFEFSESQTDWTPILLLVPLVLGLDKVNPRYIPSLRETFKFPQSLGILGGKPGVSTYLVGVQDDEAFYLDPHEAQAVININKDNVEADTSSYHCNTIRHIALESIDPSLAIGFYCRNKEDFDDFCSRASRLADESNGAPLFTVAQTRNPSKHAGHGDTSLGDVDDDSFSEALIDGTTNEDDWQLL